MFCLLAFASSLVVAPHEERAFLEWMRDNSVSFTGSEYHFRLGVFLSNARWIRSFNSQKKSFKVALNCFAALTPAEYRARLTSRMPAKFEKHGRTPLPRKLKDLPDTVDWRDKGVVSPPVDQGSCGAGWAIAAAQAVESAWAVNTGTLVELSYQNLLDCVTRCRGCEMGFPATAYEYVMDYQDGLFVSASDYPYEGAKGTCRFDKAKGIVTMTIVTLVGAGKEEDMKRKITLRGPASSCIDATKASFQLYVSGVYDEPSCSEIIQTHAVLCVGFGTTDDGVDYWIMKNSWGLGWGEQGYIRMSRNKQNQCGVATNTLLPTVK